MSIFHRLNNMKYKKLILPLLLCLTGCTQLTLENQTKHRKNVSRVFINNPNEITVISEKSSGNFIAEQFRSINPVLYVPSHNETYITWNTYEKAGVYGIFDLTVYISNISEIKSGENNKGKFGIDKLIDLKCEIDLCDDLYNESFSEYVQNINGECNEN